MEPSFDIRGNLKPYERIKLDAYLLIVYSEDHKLRNHAKSDMLYWNDWFTKSRKDKRGKRYPKGYVELEFKEKD